MNTQVDLNGFRFPAVLRYYMKRANISTDALAEKCGISTYLIRRVMTTDSETYSVHVPYTLPIVLGIGLELPPAEILFLLKKAGYLLKDPTERYDELLLEIVEKPYPKTVAGCNSFMDQAEEAPITDFGIHVPSDLEKW